MFVISVYVNSLFFGLRSLREYSAVFVSKEIGVELVNLCVSMFLSPLLLQSLTMMPKRKPMMKKPTKKTKVAVWFSGSRAMSLSALAISANGRSELDVIIVSYGSSNGICCCWSSCSGCISSSLDLAMSMRDSRSCIKWLAWEHELPSWHGLIAGLNILMYEIFKYLVMNYNYFL